MKVKRRMQRRVFTVQRNDDVERAQTMMVVNQIRHLPVLDGEDLVGILSDRDIRGVMIPQRRRGASHDNGAFYLPREVKVEEAMTADPLWVKPGTDIEEAARILVHHKIGCLPVMDKGHVVGIITDADILAVFIEIMGVLESSSRIDIVLGDDPRDMEVATDVIHRHRGRIISVGMLPNSKTSEKVFFFRLKSCDTAPIVADLKKAGFKVRDEIG